MTFRPDTAPHFPAPTEDARHDGLDHAAPVHIFPTGSPEPVERPDRCRVRLTSAGIDPRVRVRPVIESLTAGSFQRGDGSDSIIVDVWGHDITDDLASFIAADIQTAEISDLRIDIQSTNGLRTISLSNDLGLNAPTANPFGGEDHGS